MAMNYQNFASLGVNLNRQKYGPLDISNVFTSENDLKYYLTKGAHTEGVSKYWYESADKKIVPYPYEGQVLATVIDGVVNVYALALDAEGNFTTQEIAGKIEVDGKTVKLNTDGKITLVGLESVEAGKTYVPSLVNGVLTWAEPDTSTAEGQAQEINALKTRASELEKTVNGVEASEGVEAVKGLVDKVAENAQAVVDEAAARDAADKVLEGKIADALAEAKKYADDNDTDTVYDDTALAGRVKAIEDDYLKAADKYDDTDVLARLDAAEESIEAFPDAIDDAVLDAASYTDDEIAGLTVTIEQKDSVEYIVIKNADGEEITSVNASKFVQDSFLDDVAYNAETGKVTFTWKMGDKSTKTDEIDIKHLVDTYTAGNGLTVENNEFAIDTAVVATVGALNEVKATAEAAQTATEVEAAIDAKIEAENLGQYAKDADVVKTTTFDTFKTENTQAIATAKAEAVSDVEKKGYAVATTVDATYAKKTDLTAHVEAAEAAYAKASEVSAALATKIDGATIGHSTDTVAEGVTVSGTTLNIVVDAYTKEETLDKIDEKITSFTGGESAADVKNALDSYKETNNARVGAIETSLKADGTTGKAIAAAQAKADEAAASAAANANSITTVTTQVNTNKTDLDAAKTRLTALETAKGDHETRIQTAEGTITGLDTTTKNNAQAIGELQAAKTSLETEDARLAGLITGLTNSKANASNVYTKDEADAKIQEVVDAIPEVDLDPYAKTADVTALVSDINATLATKAAADTVYTKTEADNKFQTQDQVDARISTLIGAADSEDTINNVVELVSYVNNNASDIASLVATVGTHTTDIQKNASDISTINGAIADINAGILALIQPKASEEISVDTDGTLGILEVSTDKLKQGSKTLVLNGGSATEEE